MGCGLQIWVGFGALFRIEGRLTWAKDIEILDHPCCSLHGRRGNASTVNHMQLVRDIVSRQSRCGGAVHLFQNFNRLTAISAKRVSKSMVPLKRIFKEKFHRRQTNYRNLRDCRDEGTRTARSLSLYTDLYTLNRRTIRTNPTYFILENWFTWNEFVNLRGHLAYENAEGSRERLAHGAWKFLCARTACHIYSFLLLMFQSVKCSDKLLYNRKIGTNLVAVSAA